jgi:hypothetical protein
MDLPVTSRMIENQGDHVMKTFDLWDVEQAFR